MRTPAPPFFWRGGQNAKTVKDVPKSFVPAAAEKSCVSSVGSGAEAPAGAGQSPPGVQRAAPSGARRIGAGVQRAAPSERNSTRKSAAQGGGRGWGGHRFLA